MKIRTGLDLSFLTAFVNIYPFTTFCSVNKDENLAQYFFAAHRAIDFRQLLRKNYFLKL